MIKTLIYRNKIKTPEAESYRYDNRIDRYVFYKGAKWQKQSFFNK